MVKNSRELKMINIPHELSICMDAEKMKHLFQNHLPSLKNIDLNKCTIQHPRYKTYLNPASSHKSFMAAVYHLYGKHAKLNSSVNQIVYVKAYLAARSQTIYEQALFANINNDFQEYVKHINDHDMVAWLFPYDPVLTWLPKLLDEDNIRRYFSKLLLASSSENPVVTKHVETNVVNYRPEIRCTCRHEIHRLSKRIHTIYSKTYASGQGRGVFQRMLFCYQQFGQRHQSFVTALPLGYEEILHTVWMEGIHGQPVVSLLDINNADSVISILIDALVDFHTLQIKDLPVLTEDDLLSEICKKLTKLTKAFPKFTDLIVELATNLKAQKQMLPTSPMVVIHGDFHIEQLLWLDDERIALFDFDELAIACPLVDVANFCADLYTHQLGEIFTQQLIDQFFYHYQKKSPLRLNVSQFVWHLQIQLLTRAYRAYIQQKPDMENFILQMLNAALTKNHVYQKNNG